MSSCSGRNVSKFSPNGCDRTLLNSSFSSRGKRLRIETRNAELSGVEAYPQPPRSEIKEKPLRVPGCCYTANNVDIVRIARVTEGASPTNR